MSEKSNKTILYTTKAYYPNIGGIETVARQLAEGFAKSGYNVIVLCCGDKNEEAYINGVKVYRFRPFLNIGSAPLSLRYVMKFFELLKRADIVHFHALNPLAELAFCLVRGKEKFMTVCTWHLDPVRPKIFVGMYKKFLGIFLNYCSVICPTSENYLNSSEILRKYKDKCIAVPLGIHIERYPPPPTVKILILKLKSS